MFVNLMSCWIAETYTLEAWELTLARLALIADANDVNHQCASVQKWYKQVALQSVRAAHHREMRQ